ncbi:MAG: hypothetical protein ACOC71_05595 [Hyphomicrobiales bacterium]
MTATDMIGWLAAGLTLLAYSLRSLFALRVAALAANVCFILYGILAALAPVLALHVLLLPCNTFRLWQLSSLRRCRADAAAAAAKPAPNAGPASRADRDWMILTDERAAQIRRPADASAPSGYMPARAS